MTQSRAPDRNFPTLMPSSKEISSIATQPESLGVYHEVGYQTISGWDRLRSLYAKPSMEIHFSRKMTDAAFLCGFFFGGFRTSAQARETFDKSNIGRRFLSRGDAFRRRADYAIVRFAGSGFVMGFKCALISGSIVVLTTHVAAYRQRFSSWYLPLFSALVGGVSMLPLGILGTLKAMVLGATSGLTFATGLKMLAYSVDKSVDEAYWAFKREYENELLIVEDRKNEEMEQTKSTTAK